MNWKEIEEKYFKAYNKYAFWVHENFMPVSDKSTIPPDVSEVDIRKLYDFFDEQEIFIDVDHEFGEDWTFTIDENRTGHEGDDMVYLSRIEVEEYAFTKAFKILEDKLHDEEYYRTSTTRYGYNGEVLGMG